MMDVGSGFPVDLILFGMIAAFLVLRLRSILGRRTGFERQAPPAQPNKVPPGNTAKGDNPSGKAPPGKAPPGKGPIIEGRVEPAAPPPPAAARNAPDPATPVGDALNRMRRIDRSFDPGRFLSGADQAFRMIVTAFAAGDRVALRPLLSDEMYRAFETAISDREKASETQLSDIRSVQSIGIDDAALRDHTGIITVRIVSDQISYVEDRDNRPVSGTDAVTEIVDIWTFERDLAQQDPTWRLVAARSG